MEGDRRDPARVLLVTHSLTTGGAERFAATLATHLDRTGFQPELFVASDGLGYSVPEDVLVRTHGYRTLGDLWRVRGELRRRLAAAPRVDVVLSNVLSTNCLTGVSRGRRGVPWVARVGLAPERGDRGVQGLLARFVYPWATQVVSNSNEMAAAVARRYPRLGRPIMAVPNPTDFERLERRSQQPRPEAARRRPEECVVLGVGRLTPQKRFDQVLHAVAELRRSGVSVRLWLAGRGPDESRLRDLAGELGVADAVDWLGFCDNPFPLMRDADLLLQASDFEGLPNALIEAQGLGLPAVATRCPYGPGEIVVDGTTGYLVPVGDRAALVASTRRALASRGESGGWLERAGAAARRTTRQRFGLSAVLPQWQETLRAALATGSTAGRR